MGSDKGPALRLLQKRIPPKSGSSGQSEVLIKREEQVQYVWIDVLADSGRESCPRGSLNHFYEVFLPGFLRTIILIRLVHSPCFVYLRILPCVRTPLLAKMDPTKRLLSGASFDITPLWSPRSLSVYWGGLPTSGKRLT